MEYKEAKFKVDCWNCGTEMEYTSKDIEMVKVAYIANSEVACPICRRYNNHDLKNKIK